MEIKEIIKKVRQINTLPTVMNKIIELADNPKTTAKEITQVIQLDPALSLKVLKLVNSPYYGFPREITTITHAVVILGFDNIKNLALDVSVFDFFKNFSIEGFDSRQFWEHSLGVAIASKIIAQRDGYKEPEEVFTTGLLHDVGKLILAQYMGKEYSAVLENARTGGSTVYDAERDVLKEIDHCRVGSMIAERWKLPIKFVSAIGLHHNPVIAGKVEPFIAYVHAGNILCQIRKIGFSGNFRLPQLKREVWEHLKFNKEELDIIYSQIESEVKKTQEFLKMSME